MKTQYDTQPQPETLDNAITELGLTVESVFVPWSQSRNKDNKYPSLNWKVTLKRNGWEIITTDYSAGCGHCPAYKNPGRFMSAYSGKLDKFAQTNAIKTECETGREYRNRAKTEPILPETRDVIYSLVCEADALNHNSYDDWASNFGYDEDSRKGEKIYRACLEIALKLRNALGEANLAKLQQATQDY